MTILQEKVHVAVQELKKVSLCLEKKSQKTNPNTFKTIQQYIRMFENSIREAMHIYFNPSESQLLFDYIKHLATKKDIKAILFIDANNSTDYAAGLMGLTRNIIGGNNVVSIFEKSREPEYSSHIIIGIKNNDEQNDIMLAAKLFCQ